MSIHHLENIYTNSYLIRSCWMIAKSITCDCIFATSWLVQSVYDCNSQLHSVY